VTGSCVLRETILRVVRGWSARYFIYLFIGGRAFLAGVVFGGGGILRRGHRGLAGGLGGVLGVWRWGWVGWEGGVG
jgi:hypothetical protein